jgi:hypothetical protein
MSFSHVPCSYVVQWTEEFWPAIDEVWVSFASMIVIVLVTSLFAWPQICHGGVFLLKVFDSSVVDVAYPSVLAPALRILKTTFGANMHFLFQLRWETAFFKPFTTM